MPEEVNNHFKPASGLPLTTFSEYNPNQKSPTNNYNTTNNDRKRSKAGSEEDDTLGSLNGLSGARLLTANVGGSTPNPLEIKPTQKRNRKPSSCTQCSKRKLRCNRAAQCDQCNSRKDTCKWEGGATPLFDDRAENDAKALREQVARLEALVRELTRIPPSPLSTTTPYIPNHLPSDDVFSPSLTSSTSFNTTPFPSQSHLLSSSSTHPLPAADLNSSHHSIDLRANDLAEALAQLAIQSFVLTEGSGGGRDLKIPSSLEELEDASGKRRSSGDDNGTGREMGMMGGGMSKGRGQKFVEEAKDFMDSFPQRAGLTFDFPPALHTASLSPSSSASPTLTDTSYLFREGDEQLHDTEADTFSLSPGMLGASFGNGSRAAPSIKDVMKYLPTHKEALSAYSYYSGYISWYSHPVHLATFEKQWESLQSALKLPNETAREAAIDPFFVATFLGILAMGLSMMPIKRAVRDGFPQEKGKVVDFWLEGSMAALTCGGFLDNPSVEAVRAVTIISTYFVFMAPGESSGAGMQLLALGVQVAMSLGLHRDPVHTPGRYTFFESEDRRRLFWNLFSLCILSSACLGRTWSIFDLKNIDTELPLDATDEEIMDEAKAKEGTESGRRKSEETTMTSLILRMKLAVMAKKINDRAFGIKATSYLTILELDKELREFEESIPARYQIRLDSLGAVIRTVPHVTVTEMRATFLQISLAEEFIRLHRPWLVLAAANPIYQYSRDQVLKHSRLLLALYRTPSCVKQIWGGLTYKATGAAIVLAVEILTFPDGSDADSLRAWVRSTALQLESHREVSSLCRKGAGVLRFLLEKDSQLVQQRDERNAKKARTSLTTLPYSNLRAAFADTSSVGLERYSTRGNQFAAFEDHLPHKSRQQPSSATNTNHSPSDSHSHGSHSSSVTPPLQDSTRPSSAGSASTSLSHYPIYPYPNTLSTSTSTVFGAGDGSFNFQAPDYQRSNPIPLNMSYQQGYGGPLGPVKQEYETGGEYFSRYTDYSTRSTTLPLSPNKQQTSRPTSSSISSTTPYF